MRSAIRFLPAIVLLCASAQLHAQSVVRLRIGLLLDSSATEARKGVAFGLREAQYSAALIGGAIDTVNLSRAPAASVDAILVGDRYDAGAQVPVLALLPAVGMSSAVLRLQPLTRSGERRVVVWHSSLSRFGAEQLNARYRATTGEEMSPDAWAGWFAVKLLWDSASRLRGQLLADYLRDSTRRFDGHKGAGLHFARTGELVQPLYVIERTGGVWRMLSDVKP